jgi:Zn-dependent peptidase ImmA (M78 family)
MDKRRIEQAARGLQGLVWSNRAVLWPDRDPDNTPRIEAVDPAAAAFVLGISYVEFEELGRFGQGRDRFEVAGVFSRERNEIAVSRKFRRETMRFTIAHELGHWLLHKADRGHRDMPIEGLNGRMGRRTLQEAEADYFAACFLLPRNLVREEFEMRFRPNVPFDVNDDTAFLLCPKDPDSLMRAGHGRSEAAAALAVRESWNGRRFKASLVQHFRVSIPTMAIRLTELDLITE